MKNVVCLTPAQTVVSGEDTRRCTLCQLPVSMLLHLSMMNGDPARIFSLMRSGIMAHNPYRHEMGMDQTMALDLSGDTSASISESTPLDLSGSLQTDDDEQDSGQESDQDPGQSMAPEQDQEHCKVPEMDTSQSIKANHRPGKGFDKVAFDSHFDELDLFLMKEEAKSEQADQPGPSCRQ